MTKFVSFARNMEDIIVRRAFSEVPSGFYIDIGAGDPGFSSATKGFYETGWHGIHVSFEVHNAEKLSRLRRDISLLGDLDSVSANLCRLGSKSYDPRKRLSSYHSTGEDVHFLRVNTDQVGLPFLETIGWRDFRPWLVLLSTSVQGAPPEDLERAIIAMDYSQVYSDGFNHIFLASEMANMAEHFRTPPNLADNFVTCREQEMESEIFRLRAELAAASTSKKEVVRLYRKLLDRPNTKLGIGTEAFHEQPLLRRLNPERIIRRAIRQRFPKKPPNGKQDAGIASGLNMLEIEFEGLTLKFATGAMNDERGVGRVAKELLKELERRQITLLPDLKATMDSRPVVNFFPSIHWCPRVLPPKSVLMIHDVIPLLLPHVFPDHIVREWIYKFVAIAQSADHIVTISRSSAADISAVLDIPRERISVIHNGVDISGWETDQKGVIDLPSEPYFVCIGSRDYHKNLDVVYQAICLPEAQGCKLLVVGKGFKQNEERVNPTIKERVRFLGRLSDQDLAHVLKGARALLFPSIYEGFGLPPLEAALLGVPTIASARPAMTEILTQGVHFCQPHDPQEWAKAMKEFSEREPYPDSAEELKQHVADKFNWRGSSDELLKVIRRVAEGA